MFDQRSLKALYQHIAAKNRNIDVFCIFLAQKNGNVRTPAPYIMLVFLSAKNKLLCSSIRHLVPRRSEHLDAALQSIIVTPECIGWTCE